MTFRRNLLCWTALGLLAWPAAMPLRAAAAAVESAVADTGSANSGDRTGVSVFDPAHTAFGFELRTRWGQRVRGRFPVYEGVVMELPDGSSQIRIHLATAAVEVEGSQRYAEMARGEGFFDAANYPDIEFVSEPHDAALGHDGGTLRGRLTMHGVTRKVTFAVAPAACSRPGRDCDAVASGSVDRSNYGIDGLRLVLADRVRFTLRVRLQDASP
ncbi:MAG: YceI family protein [Lysobacter sp.]